MSRTSIPVDSDIKTRLADLKREDETWDEFLLRRASDEEPIEAGAWSTEEAETAMARLREGRDRPD